MPRCASWPKFAGGSDRRPAALVVTADGSPAGPADGKDALVRPEGLRLSASPHGNGIVTTRTFLGQLTRLSVRLSGDVVVQVDERTTEAAGISPGDSVQVTLGRPARPAGRPLC